MSESEVRDVEGRLREVAGQIDRRLDGGYAGLFDRQDADDLRQGADTITALRRELELAHTARRQIAASLDTADEENAALRQQVEALRPRQQNEGTTHWEGCWRTRGHHDCAVAKVEAMEAERSAQTTFDPMVQDYSGPTIMRARSEEA